MRSRDVMCLSISARIPSQRAARRAARERRDRPAKSAEEGRVGMLTQTQVRRYSAQSGFRDMMIAEKEVVLTFLLQVLSECGILDRLAFKGGTCLRKMFIGSLCRTVSSLRLLSISAFRSSPATAAFKPPSFRQSGRRTNASCGEPALAFGADFGRMTGYSETIWVEISEVSATCERGPISSVVPK